MPPERNIPGSPAEWLARAKGDLALAMTPLPEEGFYEDLCFHAQQAAEKAFKAVYQQHGWPFRYVHSLEELLTGLRQNGLTVPENLDESVTLTDYAFGTRYPGTEEPVSSEEYRRAVDLAQAVLAWAEGDIEQ